MSLRALLLIPILLFAACTDDTGNLSDGGTLKCQSNDDCTADTWCQMGACIPGTGNDCESDTDCNADEVCDIVTDCGATRCSGNTCVPRGCEDHDDCEEGKVCREGMCADPERCDDLGNCLDGLVCNDENLCVPPSGECQNEDDCEGDELCIDGECLPPTPCQTSADCPADLRCIQDVCQEPCENDDDCGGAPVFSCDTDTGECSQGCFQDDQCPADFICEGFSCVDAECTQDSDCDVGSDEICEGEEDGHGRCIVVVRCMDSSECPPGNLCDPQTGICEPQDPCRTDRDCPAMNYCESGFCFPSEGCMQGGCEPGFECIADLCVPSVCRGDAECTAPDICVAGTCTAPPSPNFVTEVRIITPAGVVRPGTTYAFTALALDQAGRVVHGVDFGWTSSSTAVATIDADGLATGGQASGDTEIRASVQTTNGPVTSGPVLLTNLGPPSPADVRVRVVRQTNGTPISGAQVEIVGSFGALSATTDAQGSAVFTGASPMGAFDVTAAHPDHDWISVMQNSATDLVLPLPPLTRPDVASGISGAVDLSQVSSSGALSLSLSGASMPSPLLDFNAAQLFGGDIFQVQVPIPQVPPIPIAGGNTVEIEFMGFPVPLKTTYYSRADPGLRAIWSFGGKTGLNNGGGLGDLANLATAILPLFSRFDHAVVPATNIVGIPTVVDGSDIDGDGDTTENVPDWLSFPNVPMTPNQAQRLRYQLSVDNLPFVSGGNANALIVISGVILPGLGFVPLGLDGQADDMGNGIVPTFITKMAPPHGGLEAGEYAVMAASVRFGMGTALPGPGSARLFMGPQLPALVDMSDGWLDSPVDATWSEVMRQVGLPLLPGADMYKVALSAPSGRWHIYTPAPMSQSISVPSAPAGLTDRAVGASAVVDAVDLEASASVDALFDVVSGGAIGLDRVTRGYSRAVIAP